MIWNIVRKCDKVPSFHFIRWERQSEKQISLSSLSMHGHTRVSYDYFISQRQWDTESTLIVIFTRSSSSQSANLFGKFIVVPQNFEHVSHFHFWNPYFIKTNFSDECLSMRKLNLFIFELLLPRIPTNLIKFQKVSSKTHTTTTLHNKKMWGVDMTWKQEQDRRCKLHHLLP